MSHLTASTALMAATALLSTTATAKYTLKQDLSGNNFFDKFNLFSGADPTHGFVKYLDRASAISQGLIGVFADQQSVFLGVDSKTKASDGRASVRAESSMTFNQGLLIADIAHMPDNVCGTWPAFWLLGQGTWPQNGEIDILEGVNDAQDNSVTLHTTSGCEVSNTSLPNGGGSTSPDTNAATGGFLGSMSTSNCDVAASNQDKNVGCSIHAPAADTPSWTPTYGSAFNAAGGGIYALEWTAQGISTWFFPRNSSLTQTLTSPNSTFSPDPTTFGPPLARFAGSSCNFAERFRDMRIIFNTAFCGDWAGEAGEWGKSCRAKTGRATCEEFVAENPEAFAGVYWEVLGLRWFGDDGVGMGKRGEVERRHARKWL